MLSDHPGRLLTQNRFLITRLGRFVSPWTTPEWWGKNSEAIFEALQALERGKCFGAVVGLAGIRYISDGEYDMMWDNYWREIKGPEFLRNLAEYTRAKIDEQHLEDVARLHQPRKN
jgi:hypothetical protein